MALVGGHGPSSTRVADVGVEVRTELVCCLEARQQVLEGADRIDHVSVAVEDASPSVLPAISTMAITLLR